MKLTVDNNTFTSTPGGIEISEKKYLDYIQAKGVLRYMLLLLLLLPQRFLFKLFGSNRIIYDFIQKQEQFRYGCLNPTVVLDKEKNLIATYTNLTSSGKRITPVIKISREPLHLIKNVSVDNGMRLPTVALYFRNSTDMHASAWSDFDPKIANCFTDDRSSCDHLLERLSQNNWDCLESGLKQISAHEPGLYPIQLDEHQMNFF